jgi:hypothetical protein
MLYRENKFKVGEGFHHLVELEQSTLYPRQGLTTVYFCTWVISQYLTCN